MLGTGASTADAPTNGMVRWRRKLEAAVSLADSALVAVDDQGRFRR